MDRSLSDKNATISGSSNEEDGRRNSLGGWEKDGTLKMTEGFQNGVGRSIEY